LASLRHLGGLEWLKAQGNPFSISEMKLTIICSPVPVFLIADQEEKKQRTLQARPRPHQGRSLLQLRSLRPQGL
jgi:hypothetical protein